MRVGRGHGQALARAARCVQTGRALLASPKRRAAGAAVGAPSPSLTELPFSFQGHTSLTGLMALDGNTLVSGNADTTIRCVRLAERRRRSDSRSVGSEKQSASCLAQPAPPLLP